MATKDHRIGLFGIGKKKFYSIERETLIWLWITQFDCLSHDGMPHQPISCRFRPIEHSDLLLGDCHIGGTPADDSLPDVWFLDDIHHAA